MKSSLPEHVYGSRPTKRDRRTQADIALLKKTIYDVIAEENPVTVRQTYYQLVSRGAIAKTEAEYKAVVRLLGIMRREHELPFGWIADYTRWMRKPTTWNSLRNMLEQSHKLYRRDLWNHQPSYVEIWLEKDALAGVIYRVTHEYDVPLMITRGYPSLSFIHTAAEQIAAQNKPTYLYYFGDFDPSGLDITRSVEADIRTFAPNAEIHFERVAVTKEQITDLNLPTRPTKKTDSRSRNFDGGESVEVDAISPAALRKLVEACIVPHIDRDVLAGLERVEKDERDILESIIERLDQSRDSA
ncbi:MAG: hypothetical protein ABJF23_26645 [Bryobacteraceae bacterium]